MQASLLAAAARTAEIAALKQDLERSEEELGLTKRQLEESKGKQYLVYILKRNSGENVTPTMRLYLPRVEARLRGITAL